MKQLRTWSFRTYKTHFIALILGVVLGASGCYWETKGDPREPKTNMSNSKAGLLSTTGVSAVPKESTADPDVVVSQQYVAVVNGEKVSVPIVKADDDSSSQLVSSSGSIVSKEQQGVTGQIRQTIDLTPALKKLQPQWEIGAGYMYNNESYGCVSIQRNYKENKALELTTFINTDGKLKGFMVQHKWLLR